MLIAASQGSAALAEKQPSGQASRVRDYRTTQLTNAGNSLFTLRRSGIRRSERGRTLTPNRQNGYGTLQDALRCLLADASFRIPPEPQRDFFEEDGDVH